MNKVLPKAVGYLAFGDLYVSMALYSLQTLRNQDSTTSFYCYQQRCGFAKVILLESSY